MAMRPSIAFLILLVLAPLPAASADHDGACFGLIGVANGSVECWRTGPASCHVRIANETTGPVADEPTSCPGHLCREAALAGLSVECEERALRNGGHRYETTIMLRARDGPTHDFDLSYACSRTDGAGDHSAVDEPCRLRYTRREAGPGPHTIEAAPSNRYPFLLP